VTGALIGSTGVMLMATASTASADPTVHKVFVCKYVGTPGDDERLQTGNNPISTDTHSLKGKGFTAEYPSTSQFPFWFSDAQGRSVAFAWDVKQGDGQQNEPSVEDCPAPDNPPDDKTVGAPAPDVTDPCGPDNIAFVVPADTAELDWTLLGNGDLQVKPQSGHKFEGEQVRTFTLPADSNQPCDTSTTPPANTPAPPAVVPPVVGGTESSAPKPKPQPQVKGTQSSKPKPNKPKADRPAVVLGTEAAVPTAVDAGLGSLPGAEPAQGSLLGQLLTGAGVALMLAAGWLMTLGRRKVGAREA
jgi:hypothetical protein